MKGPAFGHGGGGPGKNSITQLSGERVIETRGGVSQPYSVINNMIVLC